MEELAILVTRARAGDLDAYGVAVARLQDMACGYAYSVLGDFHAAEDAAQEAFVQAYRDLAALREPAAFPGWLRRIVLKCCDRLRRRKRLATASLEAAAGVPSAQPGPPEAAERAEMAGRVLAQVQALPAGERAATTLFYINGYSEREVADFLGVPVTTVKNRLHAARKRLRERMLSMVAGTLRDEAPDERFSTKVIEELLARPHPLDIESHPVRQIWDLIRSALPEYEAVEGGEIQGRRALAVVEENLGAAYPAGYRLGEEQFLRTQMTVTTFQAIKGRKPPVRLLAAGRVFRPCPKGEDPTHLRVFHQCDGICVEAGADLAALKATVERVLHGVLGPATMRWREHDFGFVESGLGADLKLRGRWVEVSGCGTLRPETLRKAGFDPSAVGGFAWGLGLERLAMLRFGIADIRSLWRPPYIQG